jgi:hypothetical protein
MVFNLSVVLDITSNLESVEDIVLIDSLFTKFWDDWPTRLAVIKKGRQIGMHMLHIPGWILKRLQLHFFLRLTATAISLHHMTKESRSATFSMLICFIFCFHQKFIYFSLSHYIFYSTLFDMKFIFVFWCCIAWQILVSIRFFNALGTWYHPNVKTTFWVNVIVLV